MASPNGFPQQNVSDDAPKHPQFQTYSSRLDTFVHWPILYVPKTPEELASAGFFYIGSADRVTCFHCGITFKGWESEDNPVAEHNRYAPWCKFAASQSHVEVLGGDKTHQESEDPYMVIDQTNKRSSAAPKHPQYQTYSSRLDSFVAWPIRYVPKTPEQLASAGFFYIGSADRVTCFQCGITLRDWEEEHDPVAEHQRYSGYCPFMKRLKEQEQTTNDLIDGPPQSNTGETNRDRQIPVAGAPGTKKTINNHQCLYFIKQLKLFFSDRFVVKQDQTPQDMTTLEVKLSTMKRSGEDSATFLKSNDPNENDNPESMLPVNANARNRRTGEQLGLCKLCTKRDVSVTFLPCGHFVACKSCANKVDTCMVCEKDIRRYVQV